MPLPRLDPRKTLISLLLGAAGFAGSFFTLSFNTPPFSLSINWFDFLPLLAGMAYGGRYGFIASAIGLGAWYPFFLWPDNGWACLVTSLLLIYWPTVLGYLKGRRRSMPEFWNHPVLVYPISVVIFLFITWVSFPVAMSLNPPFWNPGAERSMSTSVLNGIVLKGLVMFLVIVVFVDLLLKIPVIRKMLGLECAKESRKNGRIALAILFGSLLVWLVFVIFNRILLIEEVPRNSPHFEDPHEITALLVFLFSGVFIAALTVHYEESRLRAEDSLSTNQERLRLAVRAANIGIWDWDIVENRLLWDDSMYALFGVANGSFAGVYEAWVAAVHPDERRFAEGEIQAALEGAREFAPEFRIVRGDGAIRSIKAESRTIRDRNGKALRMIGVNMDITERKQAEEVVNRSLREKETLIRELYHRTKNTLQVVLSMILLQAEKYPAIPEIRDLAHTTETRILAIALVHEMLYQSRDLSRIAIDEYVRNLTRQVFFSFGETTQRIRLEFEVEGEYFPLDSAIPLGLILNELLTNSLKYGFPEGRTGMIRIALAGSGEARKKMIYSDDGIGVPPGFDFRKQDSLGLTLIYGVGEQQMMGRVDFENGDGVTCTFDFPASLRQDRV
ncbi:MAG: PAS domain-containing protein [Treponema sp.]|nr:PAS domain-containing protein [Treponema sp.]